MTHSTRIYSAFVQVGGEVAIAKEKERWASALNYHQTVPIPKRKEDKEKIHNAFNYHPISQRRKVK